MIGSAHFIFDDNRIPCTVMEKQKRAIVGKEKNYKLLCLAVTGSLAAGSFALKTQCEKRRCG